MTNKAFTLVELLAVVIILSIVSIISVPLVLNVINAASRSANESQIELLLDGANQLYATSYFDEDVKDLFTDVNIYNNIPVNGELPENGILKIKPNGEIYLSVYLDGICYIKDYSNTSVSVKEVSSEDDCIALTATVTPESIKDWYNDDLLVTINTNGDGFKYKLNDGEWEYIDGNSYEVVLLETTSVEVIPIKGDVTGDVVSITYNIDKTVPIITNTFNNIVLEQGVKEDLSKYFDITYDGLSGITVECTDTSLLEIGTHTASCTVTTKALNSVTGDITINIKPSCDEGLINVKLTEGLIPVEIDNYGNVTKASVDWYDYCDQRWANAVLINNETDRSIYQSASGGTTIDVNDISAYYVYIPRYEYQIFDVDTDVIDFDNGTINIRFVGKDSSNKMPDNPILGEYYTHPAFTFGDEEIEGFWIGKFELTGDTNSLSILPNLTAMRSKNVSTFYNSVSKIGYGLSTDLKLVDSHLFKNMEWGAVAYLSYSIYGTNKEVWINNNSDYITGCGGLVVNDKISSECTNQYGTVELYNQSTSGNITGVFDMSGGSYEYVMGNMQDVNGNFYPSISGFSSSGIDSKYYDVYSYGVNSNDVDAYQRGLYGDATRETTSYNNDYAVFTNLNFSWFLRGGYSTSSNGAGIFSFGRHYGYGLNYVSSRAALIVF